MKLGCRNLVLSRRNILSSMRQPRRARCASCMRNLSSTTQKHSPATRDTGTGCRTGAPLSQFRTESARLRARGPAGSELRLLLERKCQRRCVHRYSDETETTRAKKKLENTLYLASHALGNKGFGALSTDQAQCHHSRTTRSKNILIILFIF